MFTETLTESTERALGIIATGPVRDFYLGGGTAAALQLGHRVSVDLDFFREQLFDPEQLRADLAAHGIRLAQERMTPGSYQGLLADTRVRFMLYPYPLLEPTVAFGNISLASLLDIGLMKMSAIASRSARRDFIDLYFILRHLRQDHLFDVFERKLTADKTSLYHHARSLTYFDDAEQEPDPQMLQEYNWQDLKTFFKNSVKHLRLC